MLISFELGSDWTKSDLFNLIDISNHIYKTVLLGSRSKPFRVGLDLLKYNHSDPNPYTGLFKRTWIWIPCFGSIFIETWKEMFLVDEIKTGIASHYYLPRLGDKLLSATNRQIFHLLPKLQRCGRYRGKPWGTRRRSLWCYSTPCLLKFWAQYQLQLRPFLLI